jgi:hypothetical protein
MQYYAIANSYCSTISIQARNSRSVKTHTIINGHFTLGKLEHSETSDRILWRSTQGLRQVLTSLQVWYRLELVKKYNAWEVECTVIDIRIVFCRRQSRKHLSCFLFLLRNMVQNSVLLVWYNWLCLSLVVNDLHTLIHAIAMVFKVEFVSVSSWKCLAKETIPQNWRYWVVIERDISIFIVLWTTSH